MNTSKRYDELRDKTVTDFTIAPTDPGDNHWWQKYAPKWRRRVGIPRLTAESAIAEADGLLGSISLGIFRNDPEMLDKLLDARNAVRELSRAISLENWERFGGKKP